MRMTLTDRVADYLVLRRSLGFILKGVDRLLADFVADLQAAGLETVTIDAALTWATKPVGATPTWHAKRLGYVRGFAAYLHTFDPECQIPPAGLLAQPRARRDRPHIYSDAELAGLLAATSGLQPVFRAATYHTLIALLAVTGMRPGEALRLECHDVDLTAGTLRVCDSKFHDTRELPLHPTTVAALTSYARLRDSLWPHPASTRFLLSHLGSPISHATLDFTFARLRREVGLQPPPGSARRPPRLHDLRHTFAVNSVQDWHRDGIDIIRQLPALATYLGHRDPSSSYYYLTATPDLLALAASRLHGMGPRP